jgi:RimJ/RimL family protein N-acetyltransferase
VQRLLVFFGGFDAADCTSAAVEAVLRINRSDLHVDVVIGGEHPKRRQLEKVCVANGLTLHVQTTRMGELMLAADLALGAAGSTSWERCCVGLPSLVVVVAENQRPVARDCALAGVAYVPDIVATDSASLERHLHVLLENPLLLNSMSANGMKLVDGDGARRVLRAMGLSDIAIRVATVDDSRNLFEWRNHPSTRAMSRGPEPLEWSSHCAWLESVMRDADRPLLIGERRAQPVGVVRFDIRGEAAEVSIYKVPGQLERGTGTELLIAAESWLRQVRPEVHYLMAEVLGHNTVSHALFVSAGYEAGSARFTKRVS